MSKVFIHAVNIHTGGGKTLLQALARVPLAHKTTVLVDARYPISDDFFPGAEIRRIAPSVHHRFLAETWLWRNAGDKDVVLCCGNLPPLFHLRAYVVTFVQNRYLIDDLPLSGFAWPTRLRIAIERLWLSRCASHSHEFIVQTPTMRRLLNQRLCHGVTVATKPFVGDLEAYTPSTRIWPSSSAQYPSFVYIASGEPHKNHRCLLDAWRELAESGLMPSLHLTLDPVRHPDLISEIDALRRSHNVEIHNHSTLDSHGVVTLYRSSDALIFPSLSESFGLPLIEACQANLPVLAAELDYVRDILDPVQSFDPRSSQSIARAVRRFMGQPAETLPLIKADAFLDYIAGKIDQ